ncbi:hypothetical protein WR25_03944 [Diploscapter pachys]|uniref:Uncharacterized protein n=1 Tax=Diploscapter pachys TaxID=2018661 RepID=A0A2A2KSG8_9BILA|nr:hypothetical protein WR25_03944 [Diploscapter pachys]
MFVKEIDEDKPSGFDKNFSCTIDLGGCRRMCQNSDRRRRINNIGTSDIFDIINHVNVNHVSVDHVNVDYVNVDHVNIDYVNVNVNVNHDWDTGLPSSVR